MKEKKASIKTALAYYFSNMTVGKLALSWLFFIFFIKHTASISYPIAVKYIIDDFIPQKRIDMIFAMIGFVAVTGIINFYLHRIYAVKVTAIIKSISRRLRNLLVDKLQLLSLQYHSQGESGRYFSKILVDVEKTERFADMFFEFFWDALFTFLFSFVVLTWQSWRVMLVYLISVPGYIIIYNYFQKRFYQRIRDARMANEDLSQSVSQFIQTNTLTRIHGEEEYEKKRIDEKNVNIINRYLVINKDIATFGVATETFSQLFLMMIIAACAIAIIGGNLKIGVLVLFLQYVNRMTRSLSYIVHQFPTVTEFAESIYSMHEILNAPDEEQNQGKKIMKTVEGDVRFTKVRFHYNTGHQVFTDLSVDIPKGNTIALVGPSGSGKSTFVNLVLGLLRPQSGSITIDGMNINDIDMRTLRQKVGVVTQEPILFRASLMENIAHGREQLDKKEVEEALRLANALDFVNRLPEGAESIIGERGVTLSGGQKQRIAIARAIFRKPSILILDEATSSLDPDSEKEVQKSIDGILGKQTTLVIAHRLSTIFRVDRILLFEDGDIAEQGTHNELIDQNGRYARLLSIQMGMKPEKLELLKV